MRPHTFINDKYFSYANAEVSDDFTRGTRMPPINYGETNVKPIGKIDGIMFIMKKKKLAEYRGFHQRLRDLIERSKTSLGGKSDLIQSEIAQLRKKIKNFEDSQAIPTQVIEAVMVNPNITDEQVERVAQSSVQTESTSMDSNSTPEAPIKGKKINILLPLLGVGVILYFVFRKK